MKLASLVWLSELGERRRVAAHGVGSVTAHSLSTLLLQGLAPSEGVYWYNWETPSAVIAESANASAT